MKTTLGLFVKCPHPEVIEAIGIASMDFAVLDMEHTPLGARDLYPLVLAAERRRLALTVRLPCREEQYFKWVLDLGVPTIQVPHVQTAYHAQAAINHTFFPTRGLCRFVRAADFSEIPGPTYTEGANQRTHLVLQIESLRGLNNIRSILEIIAPYDVSLFLGPYDLSQALGFPGRIWDERVLAAMNSVISQCKEANVRIGTFTDTLEGIRYWAKRGVDFIEYASDLNLFFGAVKSLRQTVETANKELDTVP